VAAESQHRRDEPSGLRSRSRRSSCLPALSFSSSRPIPIFASRSTSTLTPRPALADRDDRVSVRCQARRRRDAVKILEDFGSDGGHARSPRSWTSSNPIGVLPTRRSARLQHPVDHAHDRHQGHGKADLRETYYSGFGFDDTHGMTASFMQGFDGWIYACHGFRNTPTSRARTANRRSR